MSTANSSAQRYLSSGKNSLGYTISMIGWVIQLLSGVVAILFPLFVPQAFGPSSFMFGGMMTGGYYNGMMRFGYPYGWFLASSSWASIFLIAVIVGAIGVALLRARDLGRIAVGASLVLVSAVISYPTVWGFGIGSAVMIVGAVLSFMSVFQFKD